MSIVELLQLIGEDKIKVQPLIPSIGNISLKKNGDSYVAFYTDQIKPRDLMGNPEKIGLVIWFSNEDRKRAEEHFAKQAASNGGTR